MNAHLLKVLICTILLFLSPKAKSLDGLSVNLGVNNPGSSSSGAVNLLYIWSHFAIEVGAGAIGSLYGPGISLKLVLFEKSMLRPYIHYGSGPATAANSTLQNFGVGSNTGTKQYAGLGLYVTGKSFYLFAGANSMPEITPFGGLGWDF